MTALGAVKDLSLIAANPAGKSWISEIGKVTPVISPSHTL